MIAEGGRAPDFTLPDQDGQPVTLSGLAGRPVVLYFYPKADSPGCTTQACGFRDSYPEIEEKNAFSALCGAAEVRLTVHDLPDGQLTLNGVVKQDFWHADIVEHVHFPAAITQPTLRHSRDRATR